MNDERVIDAHLRLCQCCTLVAANGECGDDCHDVEPLSALPDGTHLTLGMFWEDHTCAINAAAVEENFRNGVECDCEDLGFSQWPCDGCNDGLAGDRHAAVLWRN